MAMIGVADGSLQTNSRPKLIGLVHVATTYIHQMILQSRSDDNSTINIDVLLLFLYPWLRSSQGLKAIKTALQWLLVRIVLGQDGVVQKKCIETLQCHREMLEQQ